MCTTLAAKGTLVVVVQIIVIQTKFKKKKYKNITERKIVPKLITLNSILCFLHLLFQIICVTLRITLKKMMIMTAMQMRLNSELFSALQVISEDEGLMQKAVRSLKRIASQKRATDETDYIMSSPAMVEILKQGKEDIENDKGQVVNLEDLWK